MNRTKKLRLKAKRLKRRTDDHKTIKTSTDRAYHRPGALR